MTRPTEKTTEDKEFDDSDIIEGVFAEDSMKKMKCHHAEKSRRQKITAEEGDRGKSEEDKREDKTGGEGDEAEILEEVYATDSMKRMKGASAPRVPMWGIVASLQDEAEEGSAGEARTGRALDAILEDRSAKHLLEGLKSFRLDSERVDGSKSFTSRAG